MSLDAAKDLFKYYTEGKRVEWKQREMKKVCGADLQKNTTRNKRNANVFTKIWKTEWKWATLSAFRPPENSSLKLFFISEWLWSAKETWDIFSPTFCLLCFISFGSLHTFSYSIRFCFLQHLVIAAHTFSSYWTFPFFMLIALFRFEDYFTYLFVASVYRALCFVALQGKIQRQYLNILLSWPYREARKRKIISTNVKH